MLGINHQPNRTSVLERTEYLYFATEGVTSGTAFCRCRNWKSKLLQIKSFEIQRHINHYMPRPQDCRTARYYYIGLYRQPSRRWLWPDNTPLRKRDYKNWYIHGSTCKNEPDGYNPDCYQRTDFRYEQNSTRIFACNGPKRGRWFDTEDSSKSYFICERPYVPKTKTSKCVC